MTSNKRERLLPGGNLIVEGEPGFFLLEECTYKLPLQCEESLYEASRNYISTRLCSGCFKLTQTYPGSFDSQVHAYYRCVICMKLCEKGDLVHTTMLQNYDLSKSSLYWCNYYQHSECFHSQDIDNIVSLISKEKLI